MKPRDFSLALVLSLTPGLLTAQPEAGLQVELAAFEKALDEAVGHVSRPGAVHLLGSAHGSRGYYLAGFGAVFVVPPRSLPGPRQRVIVHRTGPGGGEVQIQIRNLERSLARIESAEMRRLMEQSLETLRSAPAEALAGPGEEEPEPAETETPHRVRQLRESWRQDAAERERQLSLLEQQAAQLQREAERVKEVAERRIESLMRDVTPPAPPAEPTSPAEPPAPPAPPAPLPRPAPWSFWFELSETEEPGRSLDAVVTDIRGATAEVLESHGARLRTLRPEEVVVVAVDFVRRTAFPAWSRPERTVLLRVKKKELDARRAGQISSEELEQRIEVVQY